GVVFDLERGGECGEIGLLAGVMLVQHRGGDDARRGRGEERLDETAAAGVERVAEIAALGLDQRRIEIAHLAHRLGWREIAHRLAGRELALHRRLEQRIALDIAARRALPGAAEAAEAMAQIEEEALALLLAIVADIDAAGDLLRNDGAERRFPRSGELGLIDALAARAPRIEPGERRRARQAAGMRRQDPLGACPHRPLPDHFHFTSARALDNPPTMRHRPGPVSEELSA